MSSSQSTGKAKEFFKAGKAAKLALILLLVVARGCPRNSHIVATGTWATGTWTSLSDGYENEKLGKTESNQW